MGKSESGVSSGETNESIQEKALIEVFQGYAKISAQLKETDFNTLLQMEENKRKEAYETILQTLENNTKEIPSSDLPFTDKKNVLIDNNPDFLANIAKLCKQITQEIISEAISDAIYSDSRPDNQIQVSNSFFSNFPINKIEYKTGASVEALEQRVETLKNHREYGLQFLNNIIHPKASKRTPVNSRRTTLNRMLNIEYKAFSIMASFNKEVIPPYKAQHKSPLTGNIYKDEKNYSPARIYSDLHKQVWQFLTKEKHTSKELTEQLDNAQKDLIKAQKIEDKYKSEPLSCQVLETNAQFDKRQELLTNNNASAKKEWQTQSVNLNSQAQKAATIALKANESFNTNITNRWAKDAVKKLNVLKP